jgi:hypothetical protein
MTGGGYSVASAAGPALFTVQLNHCAITLSLSEVLQNLLTLCLAYCNTVTIVIGQLFRQTLSSGFLASRVPIIYLVLSPCATSLTLKKGHHIREVNR